MVADPRFDVRRYVHILADFVGRPAGEILTEVDENRTNAPSHALHAFKQIFLRLVFLRVLLAILKTFFFKLFRFVK